MDAKPDPFASINGIVKTGDELEAIIGQPPQAVIDKVLPALDDLCTEFIAASPFCLIATAGADGHIDISPKGDPAGFVRVLSDNLLAIPDRPGNRRVDTFHNVLENDRVGVLFLIPGKGETLRVRGRARLSNDPAMLEPLAVAGKAPKLALIVHVDEVFMHCPKCITRSHLWDGEALGGDVPDINTAMVRHAKLPVTPEELFVEAQKQGFTDLY